jgi:hypothetical protein
LHTCDPGPVVGIELEMCGRNRAIEMAAVTRADDHT